jgi:hypothetical protein
MLEQVSKSEIFELDRRKARWLVFRSMFVLVLIVGFDSIFISNNLKDRILWGLFLIGFAWLVSKASDIIIEVPTAGFTENQKAWIVGILNRANVNVSAIICPDSGPVPSLMFGVLKIPKNCLEDWSEEELGWYLTSLIRRERWANWAFTILLLSLFLLFSASVIWAGRGSLEKLNLGPGPLLIVTLCWIRLNSQVSFSWKKHDAISTDLYGVEVAEKCLRRVLELCKEGKLIHLSVESIEKRARYLGLEIGEEKKYVRY